MLLDSNIIIYAVQPQYEALRQFIAANVPYVSAITYVEVLGYHLLAQRERKDSRYTDALLHAIAKAGDMLAVHFPKNPG